MPSRRSKSRKRSKSSKLKRSRRSKSHLSKKKKSKAKTSVKKKRSKSKHKYGKCIVGKCPNKSVQGKKCCASHKRQYGLDKPEDCPICLEKLGKKETPWPCGHYAHRKCITQGMKAECPLCRDPLKLTPEEIRKINSKMKQAQEERGMELMRALAANGPRVLDERLRQAIEARNLARIRRRERTGRAYG
jgi:Ring finger domain